MQMKKKNRSFLISIRRTQTGRSMGSQGPNDSQNAATQFSGQSQMTRDHNPQASNPQGQSANFLQETGNQVKSVAQGAADVGIGAAQGAVNLARGAAQGAANMAQGAAEAVKNTLGINSSEDQPPLSTAAGGTINEATATSLPGHPNTRI